MTGDAAATLATAYEVSSLTDGAGGNAARQVHRASDEAGEIIYKEAAAEVGRRLAAVGVASLDKTRDFNGDTVLHWAAKYGHGAVLRFVYNAKLVQDVNTCVNTDGDTPLHDAAAAQRVSFARQLMFLGASASVKNRAGRTPLSVARKLKPPNRELVEVLQKGPTGFVCAMPGR